jgi:DNA-binding NarL/FixJ family response regulator
VRVVIAEDSVLLQAGLTKLLSDGGFEVVAAVTDADQLLRAVGEHRPDVAVVDVRMPPTHTDEGIRAALVIGRQYPQVAVLVLSQYVEERYATDLLSERTAAVGYLLKDRVAHVADFLDALRRVAAGGTALDPEVVAQLLVRRRADPLDRLTPRELQVLQLMAEGRSNTGITEALRVSPSAVEKYISNIFAKLDLAPTDTDHRRVLAVLKSSAADRASATQGPPPWTAPCAPSPTSLRPGRRGLPRPPRVDGGERELGPHGQPAWGHVGSGWWVLGRGCRLQGTAVAGRRVIPAASGMGPGGVCSR